MPRDTAKKYYAVLHGRGAPFVTDSLEEYRNATLNFSASSGKGFYTKPEAEQWLREAKGNATSPRLDEINQIPTAPPSPRETPRPLFYQAPHSQKKTIVEERIHDGYEISQRVKPASSEIALSEEQESILDLVKEGGNVFFTGPAGTGKSVLLRAIIAVLLERLPKDSVAITATTGIAALAIGGRTVQSYAGIQMGKGPLDKLLQRVECSYRAVERWKRTRVWIIDEISMMDADLFDKLEAIARKIRKRGRSPFGGIQLILTGDFFQLPPVAEKSHGYRSPSQLAFKARSWHACIPQPYFLKQVFRQKDNTFIRLLSSVRLGYLTEQQADILEGLSRPITCEGGLEPASLFPKRCEVASYNDRCLRMLPGEARDYVAMDSAGWTRYREPMSIRDAKIQLENSIALQKLSLKVGAQVMLVKNVEQGVLVNGSIGRVVDFLTVREARQREIDITAPKNRGEQTPNPTLALGNNTYQTSYPSRFHSNLNISNQPLALRPITNHVFALDEKWPLVHFPNGRDLLCVPMDFEQVGFMGNLEAQRMQVPLILCWAISIHKSQGQTLDYVSVNFESVFEHGQAYVAISRATSLEGLQVIGFDPARIRAHPDALQWHNYWHDWWESQEQFEQEMDTEEAKRRYWEDSMQDISELCLTSLGDSPELGGNTLHTQ